MICNTLWWCFSVLLWWKDKFAIAFAKGIAIIGGIHSIPIHPIVAIVHWKRIEPPWREWPQMFLFQFAICLPIELICIWLTLRRISQLNFMCQMWFWSDDDEFEVNFGASWMNYKRADELGELCAIATMRESKTNPRFLFETNPGFLPPRNLRLTAPTCVAWKTWNPWISFSTSLPPLLSDNADALKLNLGDFP